MNIFFINKSVFHIPRRRLPGIPRCWWWKWWITIFHKVSIEGWDIFPIRILIFWICVTQSSSTELVLSQTLHYEKKIPNQHFFSNSDNNCAQITELTTHQHNMQNIQGYIHPRVLWWMCWFNPINSHHLYEHSKLYFINEKIELVNFSFLLW